MDLHDLHILMDQLSRNPGADDPDLAAQETELRAALDAHPEWMDEMRQRDAFDVKLSKVMPQVDVPDGLKERLLASVADQPSAVRPLPDLNRERRLRRRAVGLISLATVLSAVALWMALTPSQPDLTVAEVEQALPGLWDQFETLTGDTVPPGAVLPNGWNSGRLHFPQDWRTYNFSGQTLAVRQLEFVSSRQRTHSGLLVSLPLSSFSAETQPSSSDPFSRKPLYLKTDSGVELAIVSWTDPQTGRAFFLAVPAEDHSLKALEQLLYVQPV